MRVGTYKGERTVSELVGRFYKISGPRSSELAREAEAALIDANPQLRTMRGVRSDVVLVVPTVRGATPAEDATPAAAPLIDMVEAIRNDLKELRAALGSSAREIADEAKEAVRFAKSADVTAAARKDETLKARLGEAHGEMDAEVRGLEKFRAGHGAPLDELERDLADLVKRLQ